MHGTFVTLILGLVSGLAFPSLYNLFAIWSGPEERATLMSIVFSGISFANMINLPFSAGLCATGIDGGWPMVFYVPGGLGLLWCLIFKFLCFSTPQNHPWISDLEKMYLVTSCKVIIFTIKSTEMPLFKLAGILGEFFGEFFDLKSFNHCGEL